VSHLKQIGTLLLCGLLFMRVLVAPVIFLDYQFNKSYIIQNYCINKNRPQLHCDGKCYLAKKIQATQEKEENQSKITVYKLWLEVFHQMSDFSNKPFIIIVINPLQNYLYKNNYHYSSFFSLLKPPQG
jgi:hypothetical protein